MAKRKPRNDKTQTYIPGTEPMRIKELDRLALEYRAKRDERQAALVDEIALKQRLLDLMQNHKLCSYPVPDTDVEVVLEHGEDNIKVRKRSKKVEG